MSTPRTVSSTELRARFAARLSHLYGAEVPAYTTLVEVSQEVNQRVVAREGAEAERLGSIDRVTAERHGAIRVGTPRGAGPGGPGVRRPGHVPVRVLRPARRGTGTGPRRLDRLPSRGTGTSWPRTRSGCSPRCSSPRTGGSSTPTWSGGCRASWPPASCSPPSCSPWPTSPSSTGSCPPTTRTGTSSWPPRSFALSTDPVDRAWYTELERVSGVAADIGGVTSTHVNHLTPRVLDIDDLYASMQARGIEMIDEIQGPPRWDGPDVLLRQTSFRALAEPRTFRDPDGTLSQGSLRVRFGEVEARGIALTPAGRDRFDELVADGRPPPGRRSRPQPRRGGARRCGARGCPPPSATCASRGWASSPTASTPTSPPDGRRRSSGPRWGRGTRPRSSGPACCTPSRSSTRTSCRVRRPASSPRT